MSDNVSGALDIVSRLLPRLVELLRARLDGGESFEDVEELAERMADRIAENRDDIDDLIDEVHGE